MQHLLHSGLLVALIGASGCSLLFSSDGGLAGAVDGAVDGNPALACPERGPGIALPVFDTPETIAGVWGDGDSWMGALSADEKLIAFHRYSDSSQTDIYTATKSGSGVFIQPTQWRATADAEHPVFLERDGEALWYVTENGDRDGSIFRASLDNSTNTPFSPNDGETNQSWLWLSLDQYRAYYLNEQTLTRASSSRGTDFVIDDAFANLGDRIRSFTMSCDEREVIFQKPGESDTDDLFWATRSSIDEQFSDPQAITSINTPNDEAHPWLSMDGKRLYLDYNADLSGLSANDNNAGVQMATRQN